MASGGGKVTWPSLIWSTSRRLFFGNTILNQSSFVMRINLVVVDIKVF